MKNKQSYFLPVWTFSLMAACSIGLHAETLHIVTGSHPPYSMMEMGEYTGINTDKVKTMMSRANVLYQLEMLPWKRAYSTVLQSPNTCAYSTARNPEREELFKWIGPLSVGEWVLFALAERKFAPKTLEDLRDFTIGTYHGDIRDTYLRSRGYKVDTAGDNLQNMKKLLVDRIDLAACGKYEGNLIITQNGWRDKIVPVFTFNKSEQYLVCNKAVSDTIIERLRAALGAMDKDGTLLELEKKYEHWKISKPLNKP
jgi:polar amino acid transport system substrate-binding protein